MYYQKIRPTGPAADLAPSSLTLQKPPLDHDHGGFFSVTTYGPDGFIVTADYAYNHRTARADDDGSYTFWFNAPGQPNNMTTVSGWNMLLRFYRPSTVEAVMAYISAPERNQTQIQAADQ